MEIISSLENIGCDLPCSLALGAFGSNNGCLRCRRAGSGGVHLCFCP